MTTWRNLPEGSVGYWCGIPFRRTSDREVTSSYDGKPHVEVEYLTHGIGFDYGTLGLISADDEVESGPDIRRELDPTEERIATLEHESGRVEP